MSVVYGALIGQRHINRLCATLYANSRIIIFAGNGGTEAISRRAHDLLVTSLEVFCTAILSTAKTNT